MIKEKTLTHPLAQNGKILTSLSGKDKLIGLVFLALFLFFLTLAFTVYSYFSANGGVYENKVKLANLNLEISNEDGSALLPLNFEEVYPGWSHEMHGQIKNTGSANQIFRIQTQNGNSSFDEIGRTTHYDLTVKNRFGVVAYSSSGYLSNLGEENKSMNIVITPNDSFSYCLSLNIPEDMDDFTTPQNEDDNQYQGKDSRFDFLIQSTQEDNVSWNGFPDNSSGGNPSPS